MRTIIGAILTGAGIRYVRFAPNGQRGLDSLTQQPTDVVFVDFEMPTMHGLSFISAVRGLKTSEKFTPIIMLTGHADLERLTAARDRGVTEFLAKPVTARAIMSRLNAVIFHERPFVQSAKFIGPDRRRRADPDYAGPLRRSADQGARHI